MIWIWINGYGAVGNAGMDNYVENVKEFRSLLTESELKNVGISDELIVCFIRYRKGNTPEAFKTLEKYAEFNRTYPEMVTDLKSLCQQQLRKSIFHWVSHQRDQNGSRIYIMHLGYWKDDISPLDDTLRVIIHDFQLMAHEVETQTNGVHAIFDFKDFEIRKMAIITPGYVKKLVNILQGTFPMKVKGLHVVNHTALVNIIISMAWPFLSQKLRSRIFLHNDYFSLQKIIFPTSLPSDYNGRLGPLSDACIVSEIIKTPVNMFDCLGN